VLADLIAISPPGEVLSTTDPDALARAATRAEVRQPGTLERAFQGSPAAPGMGGSFLQTIAAVFIATSAAQMLFGGYGDPFAGTADPGGDAGDRGSGDPSGEPGTGEPTGGAPMYEDAGGSDFGGGDFGGGDFGGGDF
jgi:hypothetical protein